MTEAVKFYKQRAFWEDYLERIVSTFIQALLAGLPLVFTESIDWTAILVTALFAAGLAALKGLLAALNDPKSGASFGTTIPRDTVRTRTDESSPSDAVAEEGSDLTPGQPVKTEEPL